MDKLGVRKKDPKQSSHQHEKEKEKEKEKKRKRKPIKVIYISNPKKIVTTPAEFKGCVQLYTGRDSDVGRVFDFDTETPPKDTAAGPDQTTSSTSPVSASTVSDSGNHTIEHIDVEDFGTLGGCEDGGDDIFACLYGLEDPVAPYELPVGDGIHRLGST